MKRFFQALLLALLVGLVRPLVIGIDLGSRFFKVGLLQPGKPYEIVLNIESKRKTSTALTLGGSERLFGNTAQNTAARRPDDTILLATTLLGRTANDDALYWIKESQLPSRWYVDEERGTYRYLMADGETSYSVEEVVAMILQEAQAIASAAAGVKIKDAVVSVPPFFTQQQRQALLDAARISGLSITGLINDNTAVALDYGVKKDKEFRDAEDPRVVVFYDMGATATRASIVRYHKAPSKLDKKGNKTVGEYVVKAVAWDEHLGALSFDNVIVDAVATGFNEKRGIKDGDERDVRKFPKAVGKMRKAAEKAKEVLSTIPETAVTIEGLLDDVDFSMPISRDQVEEMAKDEVARILTPLTMALEQSGYTKDDVHSIEIVGGGSRIPVVQKKLKEFLGKDLSMSLNGDDAVGLGATLFAAKESTSHRMREMFLRDANPYPIDVRVVPLASTDADVQQDTEEKEASGEDDANTAGEISREVFPHLCRLPINKRLSFARTGDFEVFLDYANAAELPAGTSPALAKFVVEGIDKALDTYADVIVTDEDTKLGEDGEKKDGDAEGESSDGEADKAPEREKKAKASLSLQLTKMGTVALSKYDATIKVLAPVEKKKVSAADKKDSTVKDDGTSAGEDASDENKTDDSETPAESDKGQEKGEVDSSTAEEGEANQDDAVQDKGASATDDDDASAGVDATGDADASESAAGDGTDTESDTTTDTAEEEPEFVTKLKHLLLNVTQATRDDSLLRLNHTSLQASVEVLENLNEVDRRRRELEAAKNDLESHVYGVREFFYDDAVETICTEEQKETILAELSKAEDWIYEDGADVELEVYQSKLAEVKEVSEAVRFRFAELTDRPEAVEKATKRIATITEKVVGFNTSKPWINATDLHRMINKTETYSAWLLKAVAEQEATSPFESPVLTSAEIARKIVPVENAFKRLARTPKPRPPKKPLNETRANATKTNKTKTVLPEDDETVEATPNVDADDQAATDDAVDEGANDNLSNNGDSEEPNAQGEKVKTEL